MARWNQASGRTAQAWHKRYQQRSVEAERRIELLEAAGVTGLGLIRANVAGPGIPGEMSTLYVTQDGAFLGHRKLMVLLRKHGVVGPVQPSYVERATAGD